MKKILIISDTHGNHGLLKPVLAQNQDCGYLIHLGDEPDDLDIHTGLTANMQIFSVFGLYHEKFTPENNCFTIDDFHFVISHTVKLLKFEKDNTIYLFGHTHNRLFEFTDNKLIINPGHLKCTKDRGDVAGYAVLEYENNTDLTINFYNYKNKIVETKKVSFQRG